MSFDLNHHYEDRGMHLGCPFDRVQRRILSYLSIGLTQREIADTLNMTYQAVRHRLVDARASTFTLSNEHLIALCFQRGWLPLQTKDLQR